MGAAGMTSLSRITVTLVTAAFAATTVAGCSGEAAPAAAGEENAAAVANEVAYHADYPIFASTNDIVDTSTLVIEGKVTLSRVKELKADVSTSTDPEVNPQAGAPSDEIAQIPSVVVTVHDVQVTRVLKGSAKVGDVIRFNQLGGTYNGVAYTDSETAMVDDGTGTTYAFMLNEYPGSSAGADLVSPRQGLFLVDSAGTYTAVNNPEQLPAPANRSQVTTAVNS